MLEICCLLSSKNYSHSVGACLSNSEVAQLDEQLRGQTVSFAKKSRKRKIARERSSLAQSTTFSLRIPRFRIRLHLCTQTDCAEMASEHLGTRSAAGCTDWLRHTPLLSPALPPGKTRLSTLSAFSSLSCAILCRRFCSLLAELLKSDAACLRRFDVTHFFR